MVFIGTETCCSKLRVNSTMYSRYGELEEWGVYELTKKMINGANVYKHSFNTKFLYYTPYNMWAVG